MEINSLTFLYLFLPAALVVFNLTPQKFKNGVLAVISLVFIAFSQAQNFVFFLADLILLFIISKASCGFFIRAEPSPDDTTL